MSKLAVPGENGKYQAISSYFFKYDDLGLPIPCKSPDTTICSNNYEKCMSKPSETNSATKKIGCTDKYTKCLHSICGPFVTHDKE